jgi:hypothetical protein
MPTVPGLKRFDLVDVSQAIFKGIRIPKGWELPENVWAVVSRVDRIHDAATELYSSALILIESTGAYVKLVNGRDEFLFARGEQESGPKAINDPLCLDLKSSAITEWNKQHFFARSQLECAVKHFLAVVEEGVFLQLARQWCVPSSLNATDLEKWYQKVDELAKGTAKWKRFNFTFRDILLEVRDRGNATKIFGQVLTAADLLHGSGVMTRREELYHLEAHSVDVPKCRMVWVSEEVADRIEKAGHSCGPLL